MSRRKDSKTAELVDIALLTRAAFEQTAAERYAVLAGVPSTLIQEVFSRPLDQLRRAGGLGFYRSAAGRRRQPRPHLDHR